MDKGISPVVSVVLLIAIAVIAAAGVWFWVAPMLTQTQVSSTVGQYSLVLSGCSKTTGGANVSIRNVGSSTLSANSVLIVYNSAGSKVGNITLSEDLSPQELLHGEEIQNDTGDSGIISGTLYIEGTDIPKTTFTC